MLILFISWKDSNGHWTSIDSSRLKALNKKKEEEKEKKKRGRIKDGRWREENE